MMIRVGDVARQLGVSVATVRRYSNDGKIPYKNSIGGHRIYDQADIDKLLGNEPNKNKTVHYARSSKGDKQAIKNQLDALRAAYGEPDIEITDKGSGLSEKRRGLTRILNLAEKREIRVIRVTNEDRLARFGVEYIRRHLQQNDVRIETLNDRDTKTPEDELLDDFMALVASFAGRLYRLRGNNEQRKVLALAEKRIKQNERNHEELVKRNKKKLAAKMTATEDDAPERTDDTPDETSDAPDGR